MERSKLYCGVDLHYRKSTFTFLDEQGECQLVKEVPTTEQDIQSLIKSVGDHDIAYAFEAGNMMHYFNDIISHMTNIDKIYAVHPYKFKVITESKKKTDKEDSKQLAKGLLRDYLPEPVYIRRDICRQLKTLLTRISKLAKPCLY